MPTYQASTLKNMLEILKLLQVYYTLNFRHKKSSRFIKLPALFTYTLVVDCAQFERATIVLKVQWNHYRLEPCKFAPWTTDHAYHPSLENQLYIPKQLLISDCRLGLYTNPPQAITCKQKRSA
jgi:hypothetical protein